MKLPDEKTMSEMNAGSVTLTAVANTGSESVSSNISGSAVPLSSFKVFAYIANSTRLSGVEKSGLINNVALIDRMEPSPVRQKMLDNVSAVTMFLERRSVKQHNARPIRQAIQQYQATVRTVRSVQPEQVSSQLSRVAERSNVSVKQAQSAEPQAFEKIQSRSVEIDMAALNQSPVENRVVREVRGASFNDIQDEVVIHQAGASSEPIDFPQVTIPGGGDPVVAEAVQRAESEFVQQLVMPGGGESEPLPMPGGGAPVETLPQEEVFVDFVMPGGGEASAEVADTEVDEESVDVSRFV